MSTTTHSITAPTTLRSAALAEIDRYYVAAALRQHVCTLLRREMASRNLGVAQLDVMLGKRRGWVARVFGNPAERLTLNAISELIFAVTGAYDAKWSIAPREDKWPLLAGTAT